MPLNLRVPVHLIADMGYYSSRPYRQALHPYAVSTLECPHLLQRDRSKHEGGQRHDCPCVPQHVHDCQMFGGGVHRQEEMAAGETGLEDLVWVCVCVCAGAHYRDAI